MNIKRISFWALFVAVLGLIVWGVALSLSRQQSGPKVGTPAPVSAADHVEHIAGSSTTTPVELIEYSDFQCPACEAYYPLVQQVLASTTVPVTFVYRHFPLPQHPNARIAAQASEAAAAQGKFWQMYDMLFQNHAEWTDLADPTPIFDGYAQRLGLDVATFKADMTSSSTAARIATDFDEAGKLGLFQTPTFFVNGTMIQNPQSYAEFEADLQAAAR